MKLLLVLILLCGGALSQTFPNDPSVLPRQPRLFDKKLVAVEMFQAFSNSMDGYNTASWPAHCTESNPSLPLRPSAGDMAKFELKTFGEESTVTVLGKWLQGKVQQFHPHSKVAKIPFWAVGGPLMAGEWSLKSAIFNWTHGCAP